MRILYLAKHGNGFNDDEGAIAYALTKLGHDVVPILEGRCNRAEKVEADFCLFHKFHKFSFLERLKMPKVFWYFDLVDYPDKTLDWRNNQRKAWMTHAMRVIELGFCTDGDWVNNDRSGKLLWLPQGADERVAKRYKSSGHELPPILFTGTVKKTGVGRQDFVKMMHGVYGKDFNQVWDSYRDSLGQLIAGSKIVVAPDHPVTDHYWSNRVYMSLGFGAFMLHPYCETLADHYKEDCEIVFYRNRKELTEIIDLALHYTPRARKSLSDSGLKRTLAEHTYRHRCEYLIQKVKERLL